MARTLTQLETITGEEVEPNLMRQEKMVLDSEEEEETEIGSRETKDLKITTLEELPSLVEADQVQMVHLSSREEDLLEIEMKPMIRQVSPKAVTSGEMKVMKAKAAVVAGHQLSRGATENQELMVAN